MRITEAFPAHELPDEYKENFSVQEVFFRWKEATGLDLVLQPRAVSVAARLDELGGVDGTVQTSCFTISLRTRLSERTAKRAIRDLEERGFISVDRHAGLTIRLCFPEHAVTLLLEERQRRRDYASRRELNDLITNGILDEVCGLLGFDESQAKSSGAWPILRFRIRSMVSQMADLNREPQRLVRHLVDQPAGQIRNHVGFLISRASEYLHNNPQLSTSKNRAQTVMVARDRDAAREAFRDITTLLSENLGFSAKSDPRRQLTGRECANEHLKWGQEGARHQETDAGTRQPRSH